MAMKAFLVTCIQWIDGWMERVGRAVSWCTLALVLVVCADVGLRYLFNISHVATRELEWHLFAVLFLLGAGYTLKHDAHVRVDVFYQRLSPRMQALVNVVGCLVFLLPGCWLVIKTAWPFAQQAWEIREGSPDPGGIPARYLLKACLPAAFLLLAVQGISFFCRNLLVLTGREEGR